MTPKLSCSVSNLESLIFTLDGELPELAVDNVETCLIMPVLVEYQRESAKEKVVEEPKVDLVSS